MTKKPKPRGAGPMEVQMGARLRAMRMEAGISQQELGTKLGVSFQQVQKYEKGINRVSASRLMQIAGLFETTPQQLMGDGKGNGGVLFENMTYKLAQALKRLYDLNPQLATKFRNLIESVCDDLENGKKKR
jgi:transcriptional regulator with XRE-family HTH domain